MTPSKKPYVVVVGVDYSDTSHLALRQGFRAAAQQPLAEVHVIYVQTAIHPHPHADAAPQPSSTEVLVNALHCLQRLVAHELASFQAEQQKLGNRLLGNVVSHVRCLAPAEQIAQLAADLDADLVVVGTHSRTGIARLLLGSVAHAVVTLSPCPVLVVRDKRIAPECPRVEPPCPRCVEARERSGGHDLWCKQHRERHGQRHTYHQGDRAGQETNFPLVFEEN